MNFSEFISKLKTILQESKELSLYPELSYHNRLYAINEKGELYNKRDNAVFSQEKMVQFFKELFNDGDFRFRIEEVFEL
jgi:hypothetical protein